MSTMHTDAFLSTREDKKPRMILDYNSTKEGVDNLDKITATYSCQRKTARWPLLSESWQKTVFLTAFCPGHIEDKKVVGILGLMLFRIMSQSLLELDIGEFGICAVGELPLMTVLALSRDYGMGVVDLTANDFPSYS
ncbi:hypothetical protein Q8A73_010179 [Channa argus]|nr:hypothetical protein Q8A73_010179 [Channa argus]